MFKRDAFLCIPHLGNYAVSFFDIMARLCVSSSKTYSMCDGATAFSVSVARMSNTFFSLLLMLSMRYDDMNLFFETEYENIPYVVQNVELNLYDVVKKYKYATTLKANIFVTSVKKTCFAP